MPKTKNGLGPFECMSALQKFVRRSMEREAMEVAVEMAHSGGNFPKMLTNRMKVICHEDIGLAEPGLIELVDRCVTQAHEAGWDKNKSGKFLMPIATAILAMCRAKKSREVCHFLIVHNQQHQLGEYVPNFDEHEEWIYDQHTGTGRKLGRGLEHFMEHGAKLIHTDGESPDMDPYEEEAFEWLLIKHGKKELPK